MKDSGTIDEVLKANQSELVLLILGFLAAETSSRPNAIHFNLEELASFMLVRDEAELVTALEELIDYGFIAPVGGYDTADLLEECEFKILPFGAVMLVSNKYNALSAFEKCAPEYLGSMEMFFGVMEASELFEKKWQLAGYRSWAELQAQEVGKKLKTFDELFSGVIAPASDRIVTRSDNQHAWNESVQALDVAVEAIENCDDLDNEFGPEKKALLASIKAGRQLFDDVSVKVDIAKTLIVEPLKEFAKKYERELVVAAIQTALTLIGTLLLV